MDATVVRLEIPPRRDHLALVRLVVSGALAVDRRVPERRIEDLRLAVTEACVARKSSVSSSSAGGSVREPPSRTMRAVIEASPGTSAGSSEAPPLNVIVRFTRGNSCDGAR